MGPVYVLSSQEVTDRFMLRLSILHEYYKIAHKTDENPAAIIDPLINNMKGSELDKKMAVRYLIDGGYLKGSVIDYNSGFKVIVLRIDHYGINFIERVIGKFDFDCIKENLETDETIDTGEGKLKVFGRILSNTLKDQKYACGIQLIQMAAKYFTG